MLRVKNLVKTVALSTVMFGAGATVATVALSYLPMVNASSTILAQGLKQSKEEVDEDNNLKFRFQDCKRDGKNVVCNVLATNLKNENRVVYFQSTAYVRGRIIDVDGNQYVGKLIVNGQPRQDGWLSTNLIYGTPTKISYSFEVPREVTKIAALEVNYTIPEGGKDSKVVIRDINIGATNASNPGNPGDCTSPPQTNQKKPRPR